MDKDSGRNSPTFLQPEEPGEDADEGVHVTLEEIAPEQNQIMTEHLTRSGCLQWRANKRSNQPRSLPRNVRRYYKQLRRQKSTFVRETFEEEISDEPAGVEEKVANAVRISLLCNLLFLIGKAVAAYLSDSMSIISSLVDSAVDLVSGVVLWYTSRSIKGTDFYKYPEGKTRLEPLGIVVLSVIMTVASVQLIISSVTQLVEESANPVMNPPTVAIIASTVFVKALLFFYCRRIGQPSTSALAQDHRNDVVSNACALGFGYLGYKVWKNADPLGAILIGLYIAFGWWKTGAEHIRRLTGYSACPELLQKLLWVCMNHDDHIRYIDTLRAYHFGNNVLVEAHIVLPQDMILKTAHDIGESLQQKLEDFSDVERAFVHIDYDYEHHPCAEHKMGPAPPP